MAQSKTNTPILSRSLQNKSIVSRIVNQITDAIINGELKPGDKLPTETSLCATFEVGRNSIRGSNQNPGSLRRSLYQTPRRYIRK